MEEHRITEGVKRVAQIQASATGGDAMVTAIDENNSQVIYTTCERTIYRSRDRWSNDQYHEITRPTAREIMEWKLGYTVSFKTRKTTIPFMQDIMMFTNPTIKGFMDPVKLDSSKFQWYQHWRWLHQIQMLLVQVRRIAFIIATITAKLEQHSIGRNRNDFIDCD
ncbi:MAG: hypothetical protein IPG90_03965 [Bacteroidetes bacterium]|nr:hypothetical protein [Bacteroidota bacterium]